MLGKVVGDTNNNGRGINSSQILGAFKININGNIIGDLINNPNYIP